MTANGLATLPSSFGPKETVERLAAEIKARRMTVFACIDHQAEAAAVGLTLPPTEVIIFGNGKGGTPLMQAGRTAAIDLPLKALVWQEALGKTWLSYNDPEWIAKRHGLGRESRKSVTAMAARLESVAKTATSALEN